MGTHASRVVCAVTLAAASSGCSTYAISRHRAAGNVGCPDRTGPVILDTVGLGVTSAAALAPLYLDGSDGSVVASLTGGTLGLFYVSSLLATAFIDCDVSPEQRAIADESRRCRNDEAAACAAVARRADLHALSDPFAAAAADAMFGRACELGDRDACRQQGERHRYGNPDEAARYFARACALGDQASCASDPRHDDTAQRSGTCFFVAEGVAVTNHHVIDGGGSLTVLDSQGRMLAATVQRASADSDLAVLAVPTATGVAPLPLGADAGLGTHVFTIGFPFPSVLGFDPKFAEGAVSGVSGLGSRGLYQVTVPVQPGNSGGPLVDERGAVVGVIVAKLDADKVKAATGAVPENVNFAIKVSLLEQVLRDAAVAPVRAGAAVHDPVARVSAGVCQVIVQPLTRSPAASP